MKKNIFTGKLFVLTIVLIIWFISINVYGEQVQVVSIKDGDTVVVWDGRQLKNIRIAGIDAPEKRQSCGLLSKAFLAKMIEGSVVEVIGIKKDKYGRIVAILKTAEGIDISEAMVAGGYAWHYKKYSDSQKLAKLQQIAQGEKRGLWEEENVQPPWDYRKSPASRHPTGSIHIGRRFSISGSRSRPALNMTKPVHVKGYTRKDGTYVRPHTRNPPSR